MNSTPQDVDFTHCKISIKENRNYVKIKFGNVKRLEKKSM